MVTYIVASIVIIAFSAIGIKALLKEQKHKQKQLRMAEAYDRLARQFKLAVDYSEFLCYRFIGLDRKNRKLILIDHSGNEKQEQCICLHEIGESKIIHAKDEDLNIKSVLLELRISEPTNLCDFASIARNMIRLWSCQPFPGKQLTGKPRWIFINIVAMLALGPSMFCDSCLK